VSRLDHGGTPHDKGDDVWTSYVTADWLPYNDVEALITEGADLAWIGTQGGLVAFDGSNWTTFNIGRVMAIIRDDAGRKWFGTSGGVKVLSDGGTPHDQSDDTWTTFTTADGLVHNWIEGIAVDEAGRKWFVNDGNGVSVLDDAGTPYDKTDDTWTSFTAADGLAGDRVHVAAVDGPNLVWFAHESDGVSLLDYGGTPHDKSDDVWTTFTPVDGLAGNSVYAIVVDKAGRKWFGACGGVSVLDDGDTPHNKADDTWTTFPVGDCNQGIAIDGRGRKWIATGWSGVEVLDDGGTPHDQSDDVWTTYTIAEGLVDNRAQAIAVSPEGIVWIGTDGGVSRFQEAAGEYQIYLPLVLKSY
jgi:ligand-binding sensor domain-containing protein